MALGQDTLSLQKVLILARQKNGNIQAAKFNTFSQRSQLRQAEAAFLPTVRGQYQYTSSSQAFNAQNGAFFAQTESGLTTFNTNWKLLDSGERNFQLKAAQFGLKSISVTEHQTLRQTLVGTFQQYIDVLRAQENLRVVQSRLERVQAILAETEARVKVGVAAAKDILQSKADVANAQVDIISAKNNIIRAQANLKATIGWDPKTPLPKLEPVPIPDLDANQKLGDLLQEGDTNRLDLLATRLQVTQLRFNEAVSSREAGLTFDADLTYQLQVAPQNRTNRFLTFTFSYPLFDGNTLRERVRQTRANRQGTEARLLQSVRQANAEIESAYNDYTLSAEKLEAARAAYAAAELNYRAASESRKAGASGLLDVLTAQVSLATADVNVTQAIYDFALADVNLRLAVGRVVPGEE